jgi:hypothetical protein
MLDFRQVDAGGLWPGPAVLRQHHRHCDETQPEHQLLASAQVSPSGSPAEPAAEAIQEAFGRGGGRGESPHRLSPPHRAVVFLRLGSSSRERLRLGGVDAVVGSANFHERVTDGVRAWQQHEASDGASSGKS